MDMAKWFDPKKISDSYSPDRRGPRGLNSGKCSWHWDTMPGYEPCDQDAHSRGLCAMHYQRHRKMMDEGIRLPVVPGTPEYTKYMVYMSKPKWKRKSVEGLTCTHPKCKEPVKAKDLCMNHYAAMRYQVKKAERDQKFAASYLPTAKAAAPPVLTVPSGEEAASAHQPEPSHPERTLDFWLSFFSDEMQNDADLNVETVTYHFMLGDFDFEEPDDELKHSMGWEYQP